MFNHKTFQQKIGPFLLVSKLMKKVRGGFEGKFLISRLFVLEK